MRAVFVSFLLIISIAATAASPRSSDTPGMLVSTEWLAKHLHDKNLVLLHVNWTNGSYRRGHIPGARFLWINALAKDTPERSTELPSVKEAEGVIRSLGINNDSRVVVYFEGQNMTLTTRMILTLSYFGLGDRVSLLDGGFEAWKKEGREVAKGMEPVKPGHFTPQLHPELEADVQWIQDHMKDPDVTIIDARARRFYDGSSGGDHPGHIPGAVSIPFSSVADSTNKMLSVDALKEIFLNAGVKPGSKLVTYCHVGQQATLVYFAARLAGYDARVYDGSFEDWADRDLPVDNPMKK